MESKIRIKKTYKDEDLIFGKFSVSNESFHSEVEAYLSNEELKKFGKQLETFPKNTKDEIIFQAGYDIEENKLESSYIFLRTYVYDSYGHVGLEVKMKKTGKQHTQASTNFTVISEASSINRLGNELVNWNSETSDIFEHLLYEPEYK